MTEFFISYMIYTKVGFPIHDSDTFELDRIKDHNDIYNLQCLVNGHVERKYYEGDIEKVVILHIMRLPI